MTPDPRPSLPAARVRRLAPRISGAERARAALGFRDGDKGAHSSRTMMLAELSTLLAATDPTATHDDFRHVVVDENLLGKRTADNRDRSFAFLSQLYGLDPGVPTYRLLRRFWDADPGARPLLALLSACARDPLARGAAPGLLAVRQGERVDPDRIVEILGTAAARFNPKTLHSLSKNLASTFAQSGHLSGKLNKTRSRPIATPTTAAFAAALGWMEGGRGQFLLSSLWARLLDRNPSEVLDLLLAAGRAGWLDVRSAGGIVEVRMDRLLTPSELELCDAVQG